MVQNQTNLPKYEPLPVRKKLIISQSDHKAAFGFLAADAVARFQLVSRARPGIFNKLVAIFLPALADTFPRVLKKLTSPSV